MPVVVGEVVRLRLYCADLEQVSVNTWHIRIDAVTGASVGYQDIANTFDVAMGNTVPSIINNNAVYKGVGVQTVTGVPVFAEVFANAHAGVGVAGPIALPRQTCGLIRFRTGLAGRSGRGRLFAPFPSTLDNQLNGAPTPGYVTRLTAVSVSIATPGVTTVGGNSAAFTPVILHRARPGPPPVPLSFTPIVFNQAQTLWATQRRRGSYGRPNTSPI